MSLQRVPINNFRGGLNVRDSPFDLQPNETPDCSNVTLTALVGSLQMRAGITQFATTTAAADNLKQMTVGTNRFVMASINGAIVSWPVAGGAPTTLFTGTAGTIWDFAQMPDAAGNEKIWCCNGTDAPQKWDGVAVTTSAWAGGISSGINRILVWKSRLVAIGPPANPNRVYFSKTGDPEQTTGTYDFVDLRGDDDEIDACTEVNVLADRLYVFKRRSAWLFTDAATLANRRLGEPGCQARFQSDVCNEKLYFFNAQGVWSTAGVAIAYETGSINSYFPNNLNSAQINKVRLLATRDTYQRLLLALPTGSSTVNNVLIEVVPNLNFRRIGGRRYLLLPAFLPHTLSMSALANVIGSNGQWQIMGSGSTVNKLYWIFQGTSDDGTAIVAHWKSAWMAIQGEEPFERVRRLNVELSGDAIVDVFKDFNQSPDFSATLPETGTSFDSIWDNPPGTWDNGDTWDPTAVYRFARVRPESRGRFHQIQFRSLAGGQPFQINVAEIVVRGGKEH